MTGACLAIEIGDLAQPAVAHRSGKGATIRPQPSLPASSIEGYENEATYAGSGRGHLTFGRSGHRATIGLPGTGLFYTEQEPYRSRPSRAFLVVAIIVAVIALFVLLS